MDDTLKVGSWEHLEQIPTVRVTFVQATVVLLRIHQLQLTQFGPNFKGNVKARSMQARGKLVKLQAKSLD